MIIMVSVAMLYLILLEPFLAVKLNEITEFPPQRLQSKIEKSLYLEQVEPRMTKFFLFTPKSRRDGRALNIFHPESFENFDSSMDTKVIIHGFMDQVRIADWMHAMKDELLRYGNFNVIIVDWSSGNSIPYSRAAANTERVGQEIAKLLAFLRDRMGGNIKTFHLIGHSLGSHVAGFVGENIKYLGRITGLDPAMHHFKDAIPRKKLDRSDALFVDAIHTDAGGIGIVDPVGHVDFYPNGGSVQPGCTAVNYLRSLISQGVVEGIRSLICSHMRAVFLFTESINSLNCQFTASQCPNWKDHEDGRCGDCGENGEKCAVMGYHMDTARDYGNYSYFFKTADSSPYCVFEYRVKLVLVGDEGSRVLHDLYPPWKVRDIFSGKDYSLMLMGSLSHAEILLEEKNVVDRRYYSINSPRNLGVLDRAFLRWKPKAVGAALNALANVLRQKQSTMPLVTRIEVTAVNADTRHGNKYVLCASPSSFDSKNLAVGLSGSFC